MKEHSKCYRKLDNHQFLPIYDDVSNSEQIIEIGNMKLNISITPAIVKTSQGSKTIFPGTREKLIEQALRLIILKKDLGDKKEDEAIPVNFTLNELKKQLEENGHNISNEEIKEGLSVMRGCDIEIKKMIDDEFEYTFGGPILDIRFQLTTTENDENDILFSSHLHPIISQLILK